MTKISFSFHNNKSATKFKSYHKFIENMLYCRAQNKYLFAKGEKKLSPSRHFFKFYKFNFIPV